MTNGKDQGEAHICRVASVVLLMATLLLGGCASMRQLPENAGPIPVNWKTCGAAGAVIGGLLGATNSAGAAVLGAAVAGGLGAYICNDARAAGATKDNDGDGVPDNIDRCPGTPPGVKVDAHGCELDSDGDGVIDRFDQCPDTPAGSKVNSRGCPVDNDSDHDGVPNDRDKCPNTPPGAKVDANGCELDSDGDGVPDLRDQCPNTPAGAKVDEKGCEPDADGDGVPDSRDKCPDTRAGAPVDEHGCERSPDSDRDGVPDDVDKCPGTPVGTPVDANGCPRVVDSDGDGVPDAQDQCPGTPAGVKVDARGCPLKGGRDSDGDGVPDSRDLCPGTPAGVAVDDHGCPLPSSAGGQEDHGAGAAARLGSGARGEAVVLKGVNFQSGSAKLTPDSYAALDDVAAALQDNPDLKVEIAGHTDASGSAQLNRRLSRQRAEAVRSYLIGKGVKPDRLTAVGYGSSAPVASNDTEEGKRANRRVELRIR